MRDKTQPPGHLRTDLTHGDRSLDQRARVIIGHVQPDVDAGRYPVRRVVGETVNVEARVFADGHDAIRSLLLYRRTTDKDWTELSMKPLGNDRWEAKFSIQELVDYHFTVMGWVDQFETWRRDLEKRVEASQDVSLDLQIGQELVGSALKTSNGSGRQQLQKNYDALAPSHEIKKRVETALSSELSELMEKFAEQRFPSRFDREIRVLVERPRAAHGAWYEMFPRSVTSEATKHGTFRDCISRIPYVAEMGFDVLYLPPVHPIGKTHRKGKNNDPECTSEDPGSPWAIGAKDGGHASIHTELGSLEDFQSLLKEAKTHKIEVALDLAFQCSPDHPYVKEHPQWFRHRPDGSIQYAENPPKKYQDIYPLDFETEDWKGLWEELRNVVRFWIRQGVRIFRVDNPHTKAFRFWEWLIAEVRREHPEVLFLSEAFTRPSIKYHLAKIGFSQSYTYFTWRNTKQELTDYCTELFHSSVSEFFRPNLWPNTPDILPEYLQWGGRPAFMARAALAATLGSSYGIYGPAFELCENQPIEPGSEEYRNSEKYEIRHWDLKAPHSLKNFLTRLNQIRKEHPALAQNSSLRFHYIENEQILAYSKQTEGSADVIVTLVNLDPHHTQAGWLELPLEDFRIDPDRPYQMHDMLSDARYFWQGARNYVELNPQQSPAHVFCLRRKIRSEKDFDYFL